MHLAGSLKCPFCGGEVARMEDQISAGTVVDCVVCDRSCRRVYVQVPSGRWFEAAKIPDQGVM